MNHDAIGTIRQVYDGTLTSDIQVNTFRHIDRLFPVRVVRHGPRVTLPTHSKQLADFEFTSADFARIRDLIHRSAGISLSDHKRDMAYSRLARSRSAARG